MKETILLYNIVEKEILELYRTFCQDQGIVLVPVSPEEYTIPLGFLAYGSEEDKASSLTDRKEEPFTEPMLVFAGFSNQRLREVLAWHREAALPVVSLKAVLTEFNAVWDSSALYHELAEERAAFAKMK